MRIPALPEKKYSYFSRFMFWQQKRKFGKVLQATKLWGRSSWLYLTFSLLYGALIRKSSPIEQPLVYLINTRVAQINHCPFCVDLNSAFLQKLKISNEKIMALPNFQNSEHYTPAEVAALLFAEAVTRNMKDVYDATMHRLKEYYDDNQIIEITAVIAFENMSSKFNAALGVDAQGFCMITEKMGDQDV